MYAELIGNYKNYGIKSLQDNKIVCELADEELHGITAKQINPMQNEFEDIGYYVDERGYKRYGVIPKKSNLEININNPNWTNRDEEIFVRTSYYGW